MFIITDIHTDGMFLQVRPWLDCDRDCDFCYLTDAEKHTDIAFKRTALMCILKVLGDESLKDDDMIGLIGGELFCYEGLNAEWRCVADIICSIHPRIVCIGTHLLSGVDRLLRFARMLRNKDVQVCTSYDTKGRFKSDSEKRLWFDNIQKVHDAGFKVVVSCTLTDEFLKDDVEFPDWVDLRIQPVFVTEKWLIQRIEDNVDEVEYNERLAWDTDVNLVSRKDLLEYLKNHPKVAKAYCTYSDKHATYLYDFDGKNYIKNDFICSAHLAKCGHPYIAYCYKDSHKCTMCDDKAVIEW